MNAPATAANRLAHTLLPPTAWDTHREGIRPSRPGRPSSSPATMTPTNSSGRICLAKLHVASNHSRGSPGLVATATASPTTPAANGNNTHKPSMGNANARITGAGTMAATFHHGMPIHSTKTAPRVAAKMVVTPHLARQIRAHSPGTARMSVIWSAATSISVSACSPSSILKRYVPPSTPSNGAWVTAARKLRPSAVCTRQSFGAPQLANTRTPTITAKNTAFCHKGRVTSGSGMAAWPLALPSSSLR